LITRSRVTTLQFATVKLTKPCLARQLSVGDKIELEIEFRCKQPTT
jgi:hypothetical protein